jgi:hypothetical protein
LSFPTQVKAGYKITATRQAKGAKPGHNGPSIGSWRFLGRMMAHCS